MDYSHYKTLKVEIKDGIGTLSFNRPEAMNTVTGEMHDELAVIFSDLGRDDDIKVILFTGEGNHFCAGGDLRWMASMDTRAGEAPSGRDAKQIVYSLLDLEKPIVAKIRGASMGLATTLGLMCDTIFAAEDARIADPHVRVGIVAGDGGAVIWPELIGYARAKEFLMTGDVLTGKRAADIGLINHALPDDGSLDKETQAYCERLRDGAYKAICYTKISVNIGLKEKAQKIMDPSVAYELLTFNTDDHREAVDAFLNKRAPKFTGQ